MWWTLQALALVVAASATAPALLSAAGAGQGIATSRSMAVVRWRAAVREHVAGKPDAAVLSVAAWSRPDLIAVLNALTPLAGQPLNDELLRGAMLHTDIAMGNLSPLSGPLRPRPITRSPAGAWLAADAMLAQDGRTVGTSGLSPHLEFARAVLDLVRPRPDADGAVKDWYVAVGLHLLLESRLAEASPQIERARQLFPRDPAVLFVSGRLLEAFAAPGIQNAVHNAPSGTRYAVPDRPDALRRAAEFYQSAARVDPVMVEARIRLGRVLGELGRHREALAELEHASGGSRVQQYFHALLLGREYQGLRQRDAALAAFGRARALFPNAQSPRLALADLARISGGARVALDAARDVLSARESLDREDPWWWYFLGDAAEVEAAYGRFIRRLSWGTGDAP